MPDTINNLKLAELSKPRKVYDSRLKKYRNTFCPCNPEEICFMFEVEYSNLHAICNFLLNQNIVDNVFVLKLNKLMNVLADQLSSSYHQLKTRNIFNFSRTQNFCKTLKLEITLQLATGIQSAGFFTII